VKSYEIKRSTCVPQCVWTPDARLLKHVSEPSPL
jgi:hypothetical protein